MEKLLIWAVVGAIYSMLALGLQTSFEPSIAVQQEAQDIIVCPTQEPSPGDPQPRPVCTAIPVPPEQPAANICVNLSAESGPDAVRTHQVVITNLGSGHASAVQISIPTPDGEVIDANFTAPQVWVSQVTETQINLTVAQLAPHEMITATLTLADRHLQSAGDTAPWRASYTWHDADGSREGLSSLYVFGDPERRDIQPTGTLTLSIDTVANTMSAAVTGFATQEHVGLWWHVKAGDDIPLGSLQTNEKGSGQILLREDNVPTGPGYVVAGGQCSHLVMTTSWPTVQPRKNERVP